ncbi:B3 domain-containing transcription repressor VAL1 [Actinidia rufa]|uniref:B3 domain-containing transcription repressor VAL1 n=1 Tax=Actinidia rufa TaxID=165716 RepID=A0A7J0FKY8_9ERIC|nr:B3 domain-containing transcription repressor VAL1 [Actinidia rufa]
MGFRKASNSVDMQDSQTSSLANGAPSGETSTSAVNDNLPTKHGGRTNEDLLQRPMPVPEKKRSRNIGSKCKRLLMHSEDAMELRLTWAEAQELLRPPPNVKPTVVMVDDQEFEEYEASKSSWQAILLSEPPVLGKRTIFTARASGEQEQWAQCDNCSKWRRLPMDVLLSPKWTCLDNIWDSSRCSCSAPDEINPKELKGLLRVGKEPNGIAIVVHQAMCMPNRANCSAIPTVGLVTLDEPRKAGVLAENHTERRNVPQVREPSGLEALATAAVLGADAGDPDGPSAGPTTKHPRHRPGCTCIVCIQPPSGKGRHKATCICNVCLTVKRRFKTFMLRKKKREREAEIARGKDLDDVLGLMSLVHAASLPVETYLRKNGVADLGPYLLSQAAGEIDQGRLPDEGRVSSLVGYCANRGDER